MGRSPHAKPQRGLAAFGLSLAGDLSPPGAWQARAWREPGVEIELGDLRDIQAGWSGLDTVGWQAPIDGAPLVVERGVGGDHRFVHGAHPDRGRFATGTRAVHHLSADMSLLRCAPREPADPAWWRLALDSVLFTVALLHGYEALHAAAIAMPGGAVAITATTGGGKSTLLSALLGSGAALMADDVLVLEPQAEGPPLAHPAPPVMTIPVEQVASPSKAATPETICSLADELWIAVPVHPEPLPLKALVVLDRRPAALPAGAQPTLRKIDDPLAPLLNALMSFPRSPQRQRTRFELASTLAHEVALWQLTAELDTPPQVLADMLLAAICESAVAR
jgi:hypothetical protein